MTFRLEKQEKDNLKFEKGKMFTQKQEEMIKVTEGWDEKVFHLSIQPGYTMKPLFQHYGIKEAEWFV